MNQLTKPAPQTDLARQQSAAMATVGAVADAVSADATFADYITRKAKGTTRAQRFDLTCSSLNFLHYVFRWSSRLGIEAPTAEQLQTEPRAWENVSWGHC